MVEEACFSKSSFLIFILFITSFTYGQAILSGEIIFERRTNLEKRFEGNQQMLSRNNKWIKEPKIDEFKLYFDENGCLFTPIEATMADAEREWTTMKNTSYQDFKSNLIEREFNIFGTSLFYRDSLKKRDWYITRNTREIAGFQTRQAVWEANDSTRIYAWFSEQIIPGVGPESYGDLPGAILGLAIEDGGVVYFAKEVKPLSDANFRSKRPNMRAKNTYEGVDSLKKFLNELMTGRFSGVTTGRMLDDFYIW
ncbi:MAG: GLPGLI family protein [Brumimicrobium sp.]